MVMVTVVMSATLTKRPQVFSPEGSVNFPVHGACSRGARKIPKIILRPLEYLTRFTKNFRSVLPFRAGSPILLVSGLPDGADRGGVGRPSLLFFENLKAVLTADETWKFLKAISDTKKRLNPV